MSQVRSLLPELYASLAQLVAQQTLNLWVEGSSPSRGTISYGDPPPLASRRKPYDKPFENNRVAPMKVELDLA